MPRARVESHVSATPDVVESGICPHDSQVGRDEMPVRVWEKGVYNSQPYVHPASRERTPKRTTGLLTASPVAWSLNCGSPDNKTHRRPSRVSLALGTVPTQQRKLLPGPSRQRRRYVSWHAVAALVVVLFGILVVWSGFVGWPTPAQEWASLINPWLTFIP